MSAYIEFIKTIHTMLYRGTIKVVHVTQEGIYISETYKYDEALSGVDNHTQACLMLTESQPMLDHYGSALIPVTWQHNLARGLTFNLK